MGCLPWWTGWCPCIVHAVMTPPCSERQTGLEKHDLRKLHLRLAIKLGDICPFLNGATDIHVLDTKCLSGLHQPGMDLLACVIHHLHWMDCSDLPLVRHLVTSWWPALQPSLFWSMYLWHIFAMFNCFQFWKIYTFLWGNWNSVPLWNQIPFHVCWKRDTMNNNINFFS